jgi:hypothetical protein
MLANYNFENQKCILAKLLRVHVTIMEGEVRLLTSGPILLLLVDIDITAYVFQVLRTGANEKNEGHP